ncbi:MAG TPA: virulence factor SrfC family protein [Xanthobacteraceae bacterium]|jgi:hypothetical protein|nr:virulence factor SrfC family protein [Xanthobacteraceae bacterium]
MSEEALAKSCEETAATIRDGLAWIADPKNDVRVSQERPVLERILRSNAYQAHRLARSVDRPMCVGVFGPSQAGKSYLVSVLARKGETLTALFSDAARPEIDFISEINPYGEKEATGLVTRFTIHGTTTPPNFPVALRLLTQTDLIKILSNSYIFDTDHQEEKAPEPDAIDRHIARFEAKMSTAYVDVLREEDIWDVDEYFQRQLRRSEAKIFNAYWDRFARCAPRIGLHDRADLFSILWGKHQPLTDLFRTLLDYLAQLNFAEEGFCSIDALIPAMTGILNVETLAGLDHADAETLKVATRDNKIVDMPRPVIAALAAELRIVLKDNPWPFLEHTDLLDFPGYRGRTLFNLKKYLSEAKDDALKELFLRGKVDYLFQRYTAEQELTSMLLCLRPSNLDVTTLPGVIEDWIAVTHGRTPEERRGRSILLFFLLTMFDQHLAEKAGDETMPAGLRFQARLEASLIKPFAKVGDSWPLRWTPGTPFKNCFWIRNPNYKAEGVIQYEGRREIKILDHKVARIAELRAAYAGVPEVKAHFYDPLRAFDEVMRLNDGGVSYLAKSLAEVCKPGMKREQVRARLSDLRRRVSEVLAPLYVPTDAEQRIAERTAIADKAVSDFEECIARNMFGTFLRGLCLDRGELADALYEARARGSQADDNSNGGTDAKDMPARAKGNTLLSRVKSKGGDRPPPSVSRDTQSNRSSRILVRTAMQVWTRTLHDASDDEIFAAEIGVPNSTLKQVVTEMIATSRRLGLEASISESLGRVVHLGPANEAVSKAAIVAERIVGRFVGAMGARTDSRAASVFDASGIGAEPTNVQENFAIDWLKAFYDTVITNAQSMDGLVHDPEQNLRLGKILQQMDKGVLATN